MLEEFAKTQPIAFQIMKNTIEKNRISHAYLIETNSFSKKKEFVFAFAKYLLCPEHHVHETPSCSICRHDTVENMVDLKWITAEGMWIKKEQLEEVQKEFVKTALDGNKKIYVIQDASKLNASSSNAILKFLEEPEEHIIAILMVDNMYQLLPTIVSRCQIIHLKQDEKNDQKLHLSAFTEEKIDLVYHFLHYVEKHKMDALLYENKIWTSSFSNAEEVIDALTIFMYFYKDIFHILLSRNVEIFPYYQKELEELAMENTIESVCKKIEIIQKKLEQLKVNINLNLLIDDLIIQISEV